MEYKLRSKVWLYPGMAGWHFVSISKNVSAEMRDTFGRDVRGFGSIPVRSTVGKTTWKTSIFPDKKSGTYLLPLKTEVRQKENIQEGDTLSFSLRVEL